MADSFIAVLGGNVNTRTAANGYHRQVYVLGGETGTNDIAPVHAVSGLAVHTVPHASGGCSNYHAVAAASTNAANIKSSGGQVFGINIFVGQSEYPVFVKLHNTSGAPTAGSGVVRTFGVQAGQSYRAAFPHGVEFTAGIGITIVKLIADNDATVVAAGDCVVDVEYI